MSHRFNAPNMNVISISYIRNRDNTLNIEIRSTQIFKAKYKNHPYKFNYTVASEFIHEFIILIILLYFCKKKTMKNKITLKFKKLKLFVCFSSELFVALFLYSTIKKTLSFLK